LIWFSTNGSRSKTKKERPKPLFRTFAMDR
jgi:hypothetical protein